MGTAVSGTLAWGMLSAAVIGSGVGGLHLLLRLAWADYYGRQHLGTIRGITLPVQIGGQAVGPVAAGFVFDATGSYHIVFLFFACVVALGSVLVVGAVPPSQVDLVMASEADGAQ
jgi:MFS family permease